MAGWGNYPISPADTFRPERIGDLSPQGEHTIPRGLGRSYGDATLNTGQSVILTERLNRFLHFDDQKGVLLCEAGTTLEEILEVFVPRGWFLPVVPGTKFVTVGGAIAADIHGKNHHCDGTFSAHIHHLTLIQADGSSLFCSPTENEKAFWATVGGMGLTGIIGEVALQLVPVETAYMKVEHHPAKDLETVMHLLQTQGQEAKYSVAWIDCLAKGSSMGRSIVMNGRHAHTDELPPKVTAPLLLPSSTQVSVPFNFPSWTLNPLTVKAFNGFYYAVQSRKNAPFVVDYDSYFFPLDAVGSWNRIYGKKGFIQYQFVLPTEDSARGLLTLLDRLTTHRCASFLAVLKCFGPQGKGLLSFPSPGYTLALDIPVKNNALFSFLDELDELVMGYGGRVYLAKDTRLSPKSFRRMYPLYEPWLEVKQALDPQGRFSSDLSRRLKMGEL